MNCSNNIVTKEYLEQRLAQLDLSLDRNEVKQTVNALINDREVDFSAIWAGLLAVGGFAIQTIGSLLGIVPGAIQDVQNKLEEKRQEEQQTQIDLSDIKSRLSSLESKVEAVINEQIRQRTSINQNKEDIKKIDREVSNVSNTLDTFLNDIWLDVRNRFEKVAFQVEELLNLPPLIEELQRDTEILKEENRRQNEFDRYLDGEGKQLANVVSLTYQQLSSAIVDLALNDAGFFQQDAALWNELQRLEQRQNSLAYRPSQPTIRTTTDDQGFSITVTTDGGTATGRVRFPSAPEPPELNPQIQLNRFGQQLTVSLAIAGKDTQDSTTLPAVDDDGGDQITRIIRQTVDIEQLLEQGRQIQQNQSAILTAIATVGTIGVNTFNRVDPASLANAAAAGTCNTLNGGCGQNFRQQIKNDGLQNLQTLDTAGTAGIAAQVGQVQTRLATLSNRLGLDRAMHAYNLAVTTHNAVCLSRAVGETFTYIVDNIALASGFEWTDTEGSPITFSGVLGNTFRGFVQEAVGADLYNASIANFNKALRVYQTGQNVAWAVRGIVDPIQNIAITAADNTGKIGNALRNSGAVLENSYSILPEQNTVQSATQAKLATYTNSIQNIGEGLEVFGQVTENVIEIQQTSQELQESSSAFSAAIDEAASDGETERNEGKVEATPATVSLLDLVPQPISAP